MSYTDKQLKFIKENQASLSRKELTDLYNNKFLQNKTVAAISLYCIRNNLKQEQYTPRNQSNLTSEQIIWLAENANKTSFKNLTIMFNKRFNKSKTVKQITESCNRRKILNNIDEKFLKKEKPHNYGIIKRKKGDVWKKDDKLYIVVSEEKHINIQNRSKLFSRYLYEKHYDVILSDNDCIIHLDRDYMNCDIKNLYCIPNRFLFLLNSNKWLAKNKTEQREFTLAAINYCELYYALSGEK